jgi:rod shape-determining protein MreC
MNAFLKKQNLKLPLPQSRRGFSITWQKIAGGILVLILCIGLLNIFQAPIKNVFYTLISPVTNLFLKAGDNTHSFFQPLLNAKGLGQENNNLKEENQKLLSQISALQETVKQDQSIKEIIQNTQGDHFTMAVAGVIGLDSENDFILIDKGSQNGISENMPVVSGTKVLFGKVYKVYKNFSQVMLVSNKNSVVDASIQQNDITLPSILGAVKGSGNLLAYLDLVSSQAQLKEGDALVASGLEGVFPKGLLIGKIISSEKNDLKPFQVAKIQLFSDVKNSENLFVITDYLKSTSK